MSSMPGHHHVAHLGVTMYMPVYLKPSFGIMMSSIVSGGYSSSELALLVAMLLNALLQRQLDLCSRLGIIYRHLYMCH